MGWLTQALAPEPVSLSPENPANPPFPQSWYGEGLAGVDAGVQLNELNSRSAAGVLACVRVIAEAAAAYPKEIYQRLPNGKRLAAEHPLYPIIHDAPNPQMTNFIFWVGIISQTCIWGNGYAEIQRDGSNRARALWPLPAGSTRPYRLDGALVYRSTAGMQAGEERAILPENILHLPFLSLNGLEGQSPIQIKRQSLSLSMAAERFGAQFFGRGARPTGLIVPSESLNPEQRANLKSSMQAGMSGSSALGLALMPAGVEFKPLTIKPEEAQFLLTRGWQVEDIARDYRVPAHMIGLLERATHSNAEQLGYDFSTYTMLAWVLMIEQEINRKLFSGPFYCKLDMDIFLRGDFETRTKGYQLLRNIGVMSTNDINDREGWPRLPEEEGGDVRMVPLNFTPLTSMYKLSTQEPAKVEPPIVPEGGAGNPTEPTKDEASELRGRFAIGYLRMFQDATGRTIAREKKDEAAIKRIWMPVLSGLAESVAAISSVSVSPSMSTFLDDYAGAIAKRCVEWRKDSTDSIVAAEFERAYTAVTEKL